MNTTANTLPDNTKKASIEVLQRNLYDAIDISCQTKQAHWNVKGPNFIGLHELFDQLNVGIHGHIDILAERLVALGGQADGTVQGVAAKTTLRAYDPNLKRQERHLDSLISSFSEFGHNIRQASDIVSEFGDQNSSDLLTEISRDLDKSLWLLEAHK